MQPERRAAALQSFAFLILAGVILFGTAGRVDLWNFWVLLTIFALTFAVSLVTVSPDLMRERMRPGGGRPPVALYAASATMFVEFAMAGLDCGRLHWSDTVPPLLVIVALILLALAFLASLWIVRTNPYFSSVPRIQKDRGQTVIDTGPYAWVRHPGYAVGFVFVPASGLALGSWLATAIALLGLPFLLWRTTAEDRMLREQLDGYADYATRVRWRLLPRVW